MPARSARRAIGGAFVAVVFVAGLAAVRAERGAPSASQVIGIGRRTTDRLSPSAELARLVDMALAVRTPTRSAAEFEKAAATYRGMIDALAAVPAPVLSLDDQVDRSLLDAHVRTRLWEIDTIKLHEVDPVSYLALGRTSALFLRPGAIADAGIRVALDELKQLPAVLANGRTNLKNPARTWTENAQYTCYYATLLLRDYVPRAEVDDPSLKAQLGEAATAALAAVERYESWLADDLLPRSTRSPAWTPGEIEFYQFVHEQLDGYGVEEMIRLAAAEEESLTAQMTALAKRIHPSGNLETVWAAMKEEAPPWEGVIPMAQRYVDLASDWLRADGAHVVTIPDYLDYGAVLAPPMARRILSFGGASPGPTVAGRQSGFYVLTPLEDRLTAEEKASRIKSYNPYWTHVISYHEWLGHTVQIAAREANVTTAHAQWLPQHLFQPGLVVLSREVVRRRGLLRRHAAVHGSAEDADGASPDEDVARAAHPDEMQDGYWSDVVRRGGDGLRREDRHGADERLHRGPARLANRPRHQVARSSARSSSCSCATSTRVAWDGPIRSSASTIGC